DKSRFDESQPVQPIEGDHGIGGLPQPHRKPCGDRKYQRAVGYALFEWAALGQFLINMYFVPVAGYTRGINYIGLGDSAAGSDRLLANLEVIIIFSHLSPHFDHPVNI